VVEKWKPIPSLRGLYSASSLGRIRSNARKVRYVHWVTGKEYWRLKRAKVTYQQVQNGGYLLAFTCINNKRKASTVHSLVAEAFIGPRPKGFDVCHKDGSRTNNVPRNLRYDTRSGNFADMHSHGTYYLRCGGAKLSPKKILKIRKLLKQKISMTLIGAKFGVDRKTIEKIKYGKAWKHV
jgi:HNH endonuclease/NUMOD4 motif-containing protein